MNGPNIPRQPPAASGPDPSRSTQAGAGLKAGLLAFIIAYMILLVAALIDAWANEFARIRSLLGVSGSKELPKLLQSCIFAMIGSGLGAGTLSLVSCHKYIAVKRDFQQAHVWGYFMAPWLAVILGLIVFALFQSGLMIFAGGAPAATPNEAAQLGNLAVGFLSGFGWYDVTVKLRALVRRLFRNEPTEASEEVKGMPPDAGIKARMQPGLSDDRKPLTGTLRAGTPAGIDEESRDPEGGGTRADPVQQGIDL